MERQARRTMTNPIADRASLAKAITLIESAREDHAKEAQALLQSVLPKTGKAIRIGISGVPGVGKSTFIEAFGLEVIRQGHKVAVLAVDPSSARTGGSILGDKTRMEKLSNHPDAFIRPSPAGGALGGVARNTREAMLLCEAAGYDVILIETVGVGQSETDVADMVDLFLLLLLPSGGDELQGIKRGIMELADLVVINKADGELLPAANRTRAEYAAALRLMRPKGEPAPQVLLCSALEGNGVAEVWERIGAYREEAERSGRLAQKRAGQARAWIWKEIREQLMQRFRDAPAVRERIRDSEKDVERHKLTPSAAARELLAAFFAEKP
jgi:LAO/AO transport system kinase